MYGKHKINMLFAKSCLISYQATSFSS